MSNAVQKVKSTLLEMFELFGRRPEWAPNGRVRRSSLGIEYHAELRAVGEAVKAHHSQRHGRPEILRNDDCPTWLSYSARAFYDSGSQ